MRKIGRNDPCLCGSGKKYKRCCDAEAGLAVTKEQKPDYFAINKNIAYKGKIGAKRSVFCQEYIKKKKKSLSLVEQSQVKMTTKTGKSISCLKWCHFCCSSYIEASIQECEAIVYYLYKNDEILRTFLQNYPGWREDIKRNGDLFKRISLRWDIDTKYQDEQIITKQFDDENMKYYRQNIPCPFLYDGLCLIYKVRPYTCAALISTSPPDWCRTDSLNKSDMLTVFTPDIFADLSFYYGEFETRVLSFMPLTVYEILKNGTFYLSRIVPGLENLNSEFCTDPDVLSILKKYGILKY